MNRPCLGIYFFNKEGDPKFGQEHAHVSFGSADRGQNGTP